MQASPTGRSSSDRSSSSDQGPSNSEEPEFRRAPLMVGRTVVGRTGLEPVTPCVSCRSEACAGLSRAVWSNTLRDSEIPDVSRGVTRIAGLATELATKLPLPVTQGVVPSRRQRSKILLRLQAVGTLCALR